MNHKHFEDLLLSDKPLSPDESYELQEHLQKCAQCRNLKENLESVETLFATTPELEPRLGFSNRWRERLAIEKKTEVIFRNRWQSLILLVLIGNGLLIALFILGFQFSGYFLNPSQLLLSMIARFTSIYTALNIILEIILVLFQTIPGVFPPIFWIMSLTLMMVTCFLWFVLLNRLDFSRRKVKP